MEQKKYGRRGFLKGRGRVIAGIAIVPSFLGKTPKIETVNFDDANKNTDKFYNMYTSLYSPFVADTRGRIKRRG